MEIDMRLSVVALTVGVICSGADKQNCNSDQVDNTMLLQLIWLLTNESKTQ